MVADVGAGLVAYLWGIETYYELSGRVNQLELVAYLWGIETNYGLILLMLVDGVSSLPMRDWNLIPYIFAPFVFLR